MSMETPRDPSPAAEELFGIVKCTRHEDDALEFLTEHYDMLFAALNRPAPSADAVERVARAMAEMADMNWQALPEKPDIACGHGMPEGCKSYWLLLARAAIAAMQPALPDVALLEGTTPGPWKVDSFCCERDHPLRIAMPDVRTFPGATIAFAEHNWNDADKNERRISWKEAECNARLIAAAPDLARENARLLAESATAWQQGYNHGADKFRAALETERLIVASLRREVKIADDQWDAKCDQIAAKDAELATLRAECEQMRETLRHAATALAYAGFHATSRVCSAALDTGASA